MVIKPWLRYFLVFMAGAIFGVALLTIIAVVRPKGPEALPTSAPITTRT